MAEGIVRGEERGWKGEGGNTCGLKWAKATLFCASRDMLKRR